MIGAHRLADVAARLSPGGGAGDPNAGSIDQSAVAAIREQWTATRTAIAAEVAQVRA
jgi:hypothetical protein